MAKSPDSIRVLGFSGSIYYGWIIVAVCSMTMAIAYGVMYSFSVFFKPIVAHFNWDRTTVSSILLRVSGFPGSRFHRYRLADRSIRPHENICILRHHGRPGIGAVASRVTHLWQFYVSYGCIVAIGLSGAYTIGSAVTARWFIRKRGIALGLVAAGSGLGTMTLVPLAGFLIATYNWSTALAVLGIGAGFFIVSTAFLLKSGPRQPGRLNSKPALPVSGPAPDMTLKSAAASKAMMILVTTFLLINFCLQMVMIHLVNYATDIGISSLQAAGFIGCIGVVSIAGRLLMGGASDRIGTYNSLIICSVLLLVSLVVLLFNTSLFGFYVFAVIFGFAYGGEIPQVPMFIGQLFGMRAMAALMGYLVFIGTLGGALGPWVGGKVYDSTHSYRIAFAIAAAFGLARLVLVIKSKKHLSPALNYGQ